MIVYGVRHHPGDEFADRCLSSIVRYGGKDALIITSEKADPGEANREILAQAADGGDGEHAADTAVSYTHLTLPTSDLV